MFQTLLNAPVFLYFSQRYSSPVFVPVKGEILHTGNKNNIPVHPAAYPADHLSHCKSSKNRSYPQAFDMP